MTAPPKATTSGLEFGPTDSGKLYVSAWKHRASRNPHKGFWDKGFTPQEEYGLFETCDERAWLDGGGAYWGFVDQGKRTLGQLGERLGYFPSNSVVTAPWHGYPVSSVDIDYIVPDALIDQWVADGLITKITAKRIRGGKF